MSKTLGIEDPSVIFDNKLEEIEYKGERFKCYYAKVTYIPDYCESCGVSNSTVSRMINHTAQVIKYLPFNSLPKHILMGEFKSVKQVDSAMSFIFCDPTSHKIIDIVRDRKLYSLKNYFSRFPLKERNKVLTVTMDMYEPYMSLIKEVFPNAQIIIDRFHIVQALNRALSMSRVVLMSTFRSSNRPLYNKYKRYWKLILTPFEDLNAISYRKLKLFKSWQTPKGVVEYLPSFDKNFQYSYEVVNKLRYSLNYNNSIDFMNTLDEIDANKVCFKLKIVLKTLKKYQSFINNTLKYPNITNGPIEGINNNVKLIKRISFGYRNYDNLRNRILLTSRLYASPIKKEIKQPKVA
ncbi:ISL3 family transposase [Staphylococcus shinii]|uniref:ISL3 family transposase n=1 Tax=Staphylococcus shinii TaxID=2912228 RepID=UPI003F54FA85